MSNQHPASRYVSTVPSGPDNQGTTGKKTVNPLSKPSRRQPDWLVIVVAVLFLLSIIIAFLVFGLD
ncbi:hypothetical protein [Fibrella aquatica]|jgi:hypothetical protein|uniref:hypothetical protein n=1 Tax=Fibrella aquatica TaxID=3242487 RepID=UPI00352197AB